MSRRLVWLAAFACGASLAAHADETPRLVPVRDVDVTYQALIGGKMVRERVRWLAAEEVERIDVPGRAYMLIDHRNHRTDIVDAKTRSVIETVNPLAGEIGDLKDAQFTRLDAERVAKHDCVVWKAVLSGAVTRELCLTAEGVLLREKKDDQTVLEAVKVRFGHLSAKLFDIPPNYQAAPNGNLVAIPPYGP